MSTRTYHHKKREVRKSRRIARATARLVSAVGNPSPANAFAA